MKITALETIRIDRVSEPHSGSRCTLQRELSDWEKRSFFRRRSRPTSMRPLRRSSSGATRFRSKGSRRISWATCGFRSTGAEMRGTRRLTSRSGTSWARRPDSRSPSFLAASLATRSVRTTSAPAPHMRENWGRARRIGELARNQRRYDDLNGSPSGRTNFAQELLERGDHGDEDLAVRPGRESERRRQHFQF